MTSKFANAFRTYGVGAGLLYILNQAIAKSGLKTRLRVYEILVQPVSSEPVGPSRKLGAFEIRRLEPGDDLLDRLPRSPGLVRERFDQDGICLAAIKADKLVGYQWLNLGAYDEDEVRCTFEPKPDGLAAFDYDIYVFPEHRMGFGFLALWNAANQFMAKRKIGYTCSRVSRFNTQSRKSHSHFQCRRAATAVFLAGPKRQLMFATTSPYVHLSLSARSRPRIVVDTAKYDLLPDLRV